MIQVRGVLADLWIRHRQQEQAGSSDAEVRDLLVIAWRAERTGAHEFAEIFHLNRAHSKI